MGVGILREAGDYGVGNGIPMGVGAGRNRKKFTALRNRKSTQRRGPLWATVGGEGNRECTVPEAGSWTILKPN